MWRPRSMVITDRRRLGADDDGRLTAYVAAVAQAGVDAVQVRERDVDDRRLLALTRAACEAVRGTRCRVLVNERAHVAWAAGAHGAHLRSTGLPIGRLRAVQPVPGLLGRSVHASDDAASVRGADYVVFGSVFSSTSKGPGAPVAGLSGLARWVAQAAGLPVVAVGGIGLEQCASVRVAGAAGVAGIGMFVEAYVRGADALETLVRGIHGVFGDGERAE